MYTLIKISQGTPCDMYNFYVSVKNKFKFYKVKNDYKRDSDEAALRRLILKSFFSSLKTIALKCA
jgi:hypothetical protein